MLDDAPRSAPTSVHAQLRAAAEQLSTLASDLGHADLARTIREDAHRRLDDGRVRVVVLGEIKHGKSSLINALLGESALPIGVTPTTGAVVEISAAGMGESEADLPGTYLSIQDDDGPGARVDAETFTALARGQREPEPGRHLSLKVAHERLPASLELIDTPGFNDIARFRTALSRGELPRADVLVLVLDATQVLSRSELDMLRDAVAALGGVEGGRSTNSGLRSGARCLVVINRIDLVPEDERSRIVDHMRSGLAELIPGPIEPFLTDSKTALREPSSSSPGVAAIAALRERLFALAGDSREILPARARTALLRQAKLLSYNAAIQARALHLERGEIDAEIHAVEQAMAARDADASEVRAMILEARTRIVTASSERLTSFRAELEADARAQIHKADIQTLTQVMPGAIQDAFLDFVHQERERLREELEQLTREVFATHGELARRRLLEATLPLGFRGPGLYVEPPAVLIEVGMLALGVVGTVIWYFGSTMTGMVMTIASPLATLILREKTLRDARDQARRVLPEALDGAIDQLRATSATAVERHAAALDDHLMLADRALAEQLTECLLQAGLRLDEHEHRLAALVAAGSPRSSPEPSAESTARSKATPRANEVAAERLRERVEIAAMAELGGLEDRLDDLVVRLLDLALPATPARDGSPSAPTADSELDGELEDQDDFEDGDQDDDEPKVIH